MRRHEYRCAIAGLCALSLATSQPAGAGVLHPEAAAVPPEKVAEVSLRDEKCLATAVYFEARGEPEIGQAAVAQVILNRVESEAYPDTVCDVVYQNMHRRNACQFSFACDGHADRISENKAWKRAKRVASQVVEGRSFPAAVQTATHYHADYVRPYWARKMRKLTAIGRHVFYRG